MRAVLGVSPLQEHESPILVAWRERHVGAHLVQLTELVKHHSEPEDRLKTVLEAYARICHQRGRHGSELAGLLHQDVHVARAEQQVLKLL